MPQLFYPHKLYNYLRNHHWEKGIPQEFVSRWIQEASADSLTEDDHMEFQLTLNKLGLSYALPEFDAERKNERKEKRRNFKTIPPPDKNINQVKKVERVVQVGSDSIIIPPIENFGEFKGWLLKKLDELDNSYFC